jgi:hypothetical protein
MGAVPEKGDVYIAFTDKYPENEELAVKPYTLLV